MIARARERLESGRYPHVKESAGDGCARSRVPRRHASTAWSGSSSSRWSRIPSACCRNARACCKPGGQIILVNHLYSERGLAAAVERLLAQKARELGLRPEFPFPRLAAWAQSHGGAELIERRKVPPFGVYTLVRFRRCEPQSAAA